MRFLGHYRVIGVTAASKVKRVPARTIESCLDGDGGGGGSDRLEEKRLIPILARFPFCLGTAVLNFALGAV